jgi:hypothetical protein
MVCLALWKNNRTAADPFLFFFFSLWKRMEHIGSRELGTLSLDYNHWEERRDVSFV